MNKVYLGVVVGIFIWYMVRQRRPTKIKQPRMRPTAGHQYHWT